MRNTFARVLTDLAKIDDRVVLLTGDIGNKLFDDFKQQHPDRFFNVGVAEQNMIGVAAGMAESGLRPYVYTIAPFIVYRPFEQIRTDVCYHDVPVTIVAVGAGLSYAELGPTHHSCEDIAVLRSLPNLSIVCPGDPWEVEACMRATLTARGPVYLRLGKKGEPRVHESLPRSFEIGEALVVRNGFDACLVSTGGLLPIAMEAAALMEKDNLSIAVVSMHTVKPLDTNFLSGAAKRFSLLATLEEHSLIGGLGSAVAEWCIDSGEGELEILRLGLPDRFMRTTTTQTLARAEYGLSAAEVAKAVKAKLSKRRS